MSILGLNGATLPGSDLYSAIRAARNAGFDAFEPRVPLLLDAEGASDRAAWNAEQEGLPWLPLNAIEGLFASPSHELLPRAAEIFALAARFSVGQAILVPGAAVTEPDFDVAVDEVLMLRRLAGEVGVEVLYEYIGFSGHAFSSLADAREIARRARVPLVLDTFHLAVGEVPPSKIREIACEEIGLVHLSDAHVRGRSIREIVDQDRVLPGEGNLELSGILGSILETGYEGPISIEVFDPKYGERPASDVAAEAKARSERLFHGIGFRTDPTK